MSIEFRNVGKSYGPVQALREVSFSVAPGDILGYIGPNGAGKSTTMRILTGLVRSYTGEVTVDSQDIETVRADLHRRIGYVPQEAGFQEWRTARQALRTFGLLSGLRPPALDRRIEEVLALLDLFEAADRRVLQLSGGMRQRLRLAQAILHNPDILILDEPLNGLDPASRHELKQTIRSLADGTRTVIFSSHILSEMEDLVTRIAIIHHGTLRRIGTPAELRAEFGLGMVVEIEGNEAARLRPDLFAGVALERIERMSMTVIRLHLNAGSDIDREVVGIMRSLAAAEVAVRSLRHLQPSLEDVYLKLTNGEGSR